MTNQSNTAVLHIALNPVTGPWSVLRELAVAQKRSGMYAEVAIGVITDKSWPPQYAKELESLGLPHYRKKCPKMPLGTASTLLQFIRRPSIEKWITDLALKCGRSRVVVHSHSSWLSGVYLPLKPVPSIEVIFVVTFHGVNVTFKGKPIRRMIHRWMAHRLPRHDARLVSVDSCGVSLVEDVFGLSPNLFTVIRNGTPASHHRACPYTKDSGVFTVGHVGSISNRKGWRITAEAVRRIANSGKRIRLIIAGFGPEDDSAKEFADAHSDFIEFLGFVSNSSENVMPRLDILSMMSVHEGLPMSIIEAMSVGLPVVATDVGGISEAISDGRTGLLIPRSVDALVTAIESLMADPKMLTTLSNNSVERFAEEFEIGHVIRQYQAVYSK